jgi:hypothetical protein
MLHAPTKQRNTKITHQPHRTSHGTAVPGMVKCFPCRRQHLPLTGFLQEPSKVLYGVRESVVWVCVWPVRFETCFGFLFLMSGVTRVLASAFCVRAKELGEGFRKDELGSLF